MSVHFDELAEDGEKIAHGVLAGKFTSAIRASGERTLPVYRDGGEKQNLKLLRFGPRRQQAELEPIYLGEGILLRDYQSPADTGGERVTGLVLVIATKQVFQFDGVGAASRFLLPEPHVFISCLQRGWEIDTLLGKPGGDTLLAEALVTHKNGQLRIPNQQRRQFV